MHNGPRPRLEFTEGLHRSLSVKKRKSFNVSVCEILKTSWIQSSVQYFMSRTDVMLPTGEMRARDPQICLRLWITKIISHLQMKSQLSWSVKNKFAWLANLQASSLSLNKISPRGFGETRHEKIRLSGESGELESGNVYKQQHCMKSKWKRKTERKWIP